MADHDPKLIPFPHHRRMSSSASTVSSLSAHQSELAEAELRVDIVKDLLQQISGPDGFYSQDLRLKMTAYAAEALLDEMVVLYRRAMTGMATA